jgi:hypothetical protein
LKKQDYIFPNLRRGHQSPHFFSITLMSDCLYFSPIYLREGKKLSVYFPVMWSGGKNFILQKRYHWNFSFIEQIFLFNCLLSAHLYFFPTCPF